MDERDTQLVTATAGIAAIMDKTWLYTALIGILRGRPPEVVLADFKRIELAYIEPIYKIVRLLTRDEEMLRWWSRFYIELPCESREHGEIMCGIGLYRLILGMSKEDQDEIISAWNEIKDMASEKYMP